MTSSKTTRKALFSSAVSLLLCFTMLMGATFAWFTDTVQSTGNRIQAGTLEVDLVMDKLDGEGYLSIAEPENEQARGDIFSEATGNGINWEPGKTEIVYLGVRNNGSLALKYNILLEIEDEGLIGSLEYAILDGKTSADTYENWEEVKAAADGQVGDIKAGQTVAAQGGVLDEIVNGVPEETDYFALAVHMKEEAGNEYQDKGIKIDVKVLATQKDAEEDSFGPDYDLDAEFESASADDYQSVINQGGNVRLISDIVLEEGETITVPAGTSLTLDLNGKTISGGNAKDTGAVITNNGTLVMIGGTVESTLANGDAAINNSGSLTLKDVTINGAALSGPSSYPAYAVVTTGDLVVEDGTSITSDRGAVLVEGGSAVFNGGSFTVTDVASTERTAAITLHTIAAKSDVTINGGTFENNYTGVSGASVICPWGGAVTINGGTFRDAVDDTSNFNNTANIQNYMGYSAPVKVYGGTFDDNTVNKNVAVGYAATASNGIWTVGPKEIENTAELAEVIKAGVTDITLGAGEFKMPSISSTGELTITGTKDSVVDVTKGAYLEKTTINFEGITIKTSTGYVMDENGNQGSDYAALYSPNVTYTDCVFQGPMKVGRDGAKFVRCTFEKLGNDYVWTYGNDVTFDGCTFNTDGKAILIYSDGGNEVSKVTVTGCTFNATAGAKAGAISNQNCAAIEIHNYGCGVNLTTSGNKFDEEFSGEWRIKTYEAGKPKITVNGKEYTKEALDGQLMTVTGGVAAID